MSKYCKLLQEAVNVNSTKRAIQKIQHSVTTYEQTEKRFSYFYPKK